MSIKRTILLIIFLLVSFSSSSADEKSIGKVKSASENWRSQQGLVILNDFRDLLSMPNVASNL
ncbi:MAG: hypothetical protein OEY19_14065, partial [Gammaproteobacteria bacterium]|nr:hypothetical protein [Gammaproteobacteria bacterium]